MLPKVGCAVLCADQICFTNREMGRILQSALGERIETDDSSASFRIMKVHQAFNLRLNGLLEWVMTWGWAKKGCDGGVDNFIIIGQTGIGVHCFLHVFLLLSADIAHQGRLLLSCTALGPRSHNVLSEHF